MDHDIDQLIGHYSRDDIVNDILDKYRYSNNCNNEIKFENIFKYDQFHIGGQQATQKLLDLMGGGAGLSVLDAGCGFGGVARYLAHFGGFDVTAADIVPNYVESAERIDSTLGFGGKIEYVCGDICDLAFGRRVFDWCVWVHLGGNIKNKVFALKNISKHLNKNGKIIIYDVLLSESAVREDLVYPMPWAANNKMSHINDINTYKNNLLESGFKVIYQGRM